MARPLRIEFPGAVNHVASRGNARQRVFLDEWDREAFLEAVPTLMVLGTAEYVEGLRGMAEAKREGGSTRAFSGPPQSADRKDRWQEGGHRESRLGGAGARGAHRPRVHAR